MERPANSDARRVRTLRGVLAASVATLTALGFHIAAGGSVPAPELVLVTLVLSWLPGIALIGRAPSLWRQAVVVLLAQAALHLVFTVEAVAGAGPVAADRMSGMDMPMAVGSEVAGSGAGTAPLAAVDPSGWGMWLGHLAAAILTVCAWRSGERAFWLLIGLLARIVATVLPALGLPSPVTAPVVVRDRRVPTALRATTRRIPHRGPPVLV